MGLALVASRDCAGRGAGGVGKALAREEVVMVDGKVRCSSCATAGQQPTSCEHKEDVRQGAGVRKAVEVWKGVDMRKGAGA